MKRGREIEAPGRYKDEDVARQVGYNLFSNPAPSTAKRIDIPSLDGIVPFSCKIKVYPDYTNMKFLALTLVAVSSALAAPTTAAKRSSALKITDFWANASRASGTTNMHLVLTDPNYPDDTPTDCNVIWFVPSLALLISRECRSKDTDERSIRRSFGNSPDANARCLGGNYYIRFPDGGQDISQWSIELERVEGPIPVKGTVVLNDETEGSKWKCGPTENPGVTERCNYEGVLEIPF